MTKRDRFADGTQVWSPGFGHVMPCSVTVHCTVCVSVAGAEQRPGGASELERRVR